MSSGYKFHSPQGLYFVSFSVVEWLPVFIDELYCNIIIDCLRFCQKHKGMQIYSWCIMKTHLHLVFRSEGHQHPAKLLGDLKRFTSNKIVAAIRSNPNEKRKDFFLSEFARVASTVSNVKHHQFWQHDNHPIELWSNYVIWRKINYVHLNPVKAGIVSCGSAYQYSSAIDYAGGKGLIDDIVVASRF